MFKGAIVGLGYISGKGHLPAYLKMKDVQIVAVADITPARREYARKMVPGVRTYATYQELLEKETELDFLDIATPPCDHVEIAEAAARRGLHVLCEKPVATSTDEARRLLEAAQDNQVVIFPCHNYKHAPVIKTVRELLDAGAIGKVSATTLATYRNTHAKGTAEWLPDWRRMRKYSGGGIAMDHGSHSFYLMFLFMGGQFPTAVSAKAFGVEEKWDTEDNVSAALSFKGGFSNVFLTWSAGARKVIYTIQGDKGSITISDDDFEIATATGVEKKLIVSAFNDASHTSWFTSMFEQFRQTIDAKDWVNRELQEAYVCCHLIERIYDSAQAGCRELPVDTSFAFLAKPATKVGKNGKVAKTPRRRSTPTVELD